ncbi:hypothetical protein ABZ070_10340 [Streptomyces sp. NPDC006283]|uniref:hypothetical protein n=1 Tax=Streptomyces sp. NPDC006283 TaxID=3156741 RepID=UPI0033B29D58
MPAYASTPNVLQRIAALEKRLDQVQRRGNGLADELPVFPTAFNAMPMLDSTSFITAWETTFAPRTASLSLGLVFLGDQVSSTNTGGQWQVLLDGSVVMSGSVAATYSYQFAAQTLNLGAYQASAGVKLDIQCRRTSGATTGGHFGTGGTISIAPRYARLL